MQCVTGWRVPGKPFEGVRLSHLLDAAGVRSTAGAKCASPVSTGRTRRASPSTRPADVLSLRMQEKDIGHSHGGPVRLDVAPMYFYKSAKWLSGITVTQDVEPGFWEERGYDVDAWVGRSTDRTMGRRPDPRQTAARPELDTCVRRFSAAERWAHRATAVLMGVCVVTAAYPVLGGVRRAHRPPRPRGHRARVGRHGTPGPGPGRARIPGAARRPDPAQPLRPARPSVAACGSAPGQAAGLAPGAQVQRRAEALRRLGRRCHTRNR